MAISHDDVQRIIQLLNQSHFDELHLEADGIKLDLRRNGALQQQVLPRAPTNASAPAPVPVQVGAAQKASAKAASASEDSASLYVRAPMLGTFYRAAKPGAEPFVRVGTQVSADTVIGIVEVMKLMNSVTAACAGVVLEILVQDGDLVEFDQALLRLRPLTQA